MTATQTAMPCKHNRIVSSRTETNAGWHDAQRGLRRSWRGRKDLHIQQRNEAVHRVRPVLAYRQVVVDPARTVREVSRDVLHTVLVHVSAVGRLSGVRRPVRYACRRDEARLGSDIADEPVAVDGNAVMEVSKKQPHDKKMTCTMRDCIFAVS